MNKQSDEPYPYHSPRIVKVDDQSYRIFNSIVVGKPLEETFEFCCDTRFLNEISPPRLHFTPLRQKNVKISLGTEIEYDMRLRGIPVRWRSRIAVFDPPHQFMDEQMRGPYVRWEHLHTFRDIDHQNTVIGDIVDYTLPCGNVVARTMQSLFVQNDLTYIFRYRSLRYRQLLGDPIV